MFRTKLILNAAIFCSILPATHLNADCAPQCSRYRRGPVYHQIPQTRVEPVVQHVVSPPPAAIVETTFRSSQQSLKLVEQAKSAFQRGRVNEAERLIDQVLKLSPNSASAFQFRALCNFAQKDYDAAAADVYDTLLRGPAWNWDVLKTLYSDTKVYGQQYHDLSREAAANPDSMAQHFLLGYHHIMLGHLRHGEIELNKALEIRPNEPLIAKLLTVVSDRRKTELSNRVSAKR